jgi:hypothetical protein
MKVSASFVLPSFASKQSENIPMFQGPAIRAGAPPLFHAATPAFPASAPTAIIGHHKQKQHNRPSRGRRLQGQAAAPERRSAARFVAKRVAQCRRQWRRRRRKTQQQHLQQGSTAEKVENATLHYCAALLPFWLHLHWWNYYRVY